MPVTTLEAHRPQTAQYAVWWTHIEIFITMQAQWGFLSGLEMVTLIQLLEKVQRQYSRYQFNNNIGAIGVPVLDRFPAFEELNESISGA